MPDSRTARLFKNGSSQAVRLPADFRFDGDEVYVTRDTASGNVILSSRPNAATWDAFLDLVHSAAAPDDFLVARSMNRVVGKGRV